MQKWKKGSIPFRRGEGGARLSPLAVVSFVLLITAAGGGILFLAGLSPGKAVDPVPTSWSVAPSLPAVSTSDTTAVEADAGVREQVDVVVYGSTTSGLGAVYGLARLAEKYDHSFSVALVSVTDALESPLVQGLCIEDDYEPATLAGFYGRFRRAVASYYQSQGIRPYEQGGRLKYEPEVAYEALCHLVFGTYGLPDEAQVGGSLEVRRIQGIIEGAGEGDEGHFLRVRRPDGSSLLLEATYLVDASVEADLARALGCRYMMGRSAQVFSDGQGLRPTPPTSQDLYAVSPQSLGYLTTLRVASDGAAPSVEEMPEWPEAASAMGGRWVVPESYLKTFASSWSLRHALPGGKHELNEPWSDWAEPDVIFRWYREPQSRDEIVDSMRRRALVLLAQIQERYPKVGVDRLPGWPYVRGEVMVLGERVYSLQELRSDSFEPIATGIYAAFDRHDPARGSLQQEETARARLPLGATRPADRPYLLVSTAYSLDWKAYNSACRMEPVRAAAGVACGAQVVLAAEQGIAPQAVRYTDLLEELKALGESPTRR